MRTSAYVTREAWTTHSAARTRPSRSGGGLGERGEVARAKVCDEREHHAADDARDQVKAVRLGTEVLDGLEHGAARDGLAGEVGAERAGRGDDQPVVTDLLLHKLHGNADDDRDEQDSCERCESHFVLLS